MKVTGTILACLLSCSLSSSCLSSIIYFNASNYRSVADSPFLGFKEFYLEDFEDGMFNMPNVTSQSGFVLTGVSVRSVDDDDGVIDGISNGFGSFASSEPIAPFHFFRFTPDQFGRFPTFVGAVITLESGTGFSTDTFGGRTGGGTVIPSGGIDVSDLVAVAGDAGNVAHSVFVGIFSTDGISTFGISRASQIDHFQFSYAVPEANTTLLCCVALFIGFGRRRR